MHEIFGRLFFSVVCVAMGAYVIVNRQQLGRRSAALYPPIFILLAYIIASTRGWGLGLVAAVVYGVMGLAISLTPDGVTKWSKAHPKLDGMMLGPLLFLAVAVLSPLPIWWCALGGMAGGIAGAALGKRKSRYERKSEPI